MVSMTHEKCTFVFQPSIQETQPGSHLPVVCMLAFQQTVVYVSVLQPSRGVGAAQAVPQGARTLFSGPAVPHSLASRPSGPL